MDELEYALDEELLKNMAAMLGSLHTQAHLDIIDEAGITKLCFADADDYWEALQYIRRCIRKGNKINREYAKRKYKVEMPRSNDDPKDYATDVVFATAQAQANEILNKALEIVDGDDTKRIDFYEAVALARNLLRGVACPLTGVLADTKGTEPVIYEDAKSLREPPPQKWLVRGIIPDNWPTFLYGSGGSAKSYLAVLLALSVATGTQFLGKRATGRKVLYLDWEMDEPTFRGRVNRVAKGMGFSLKSGIPNLMYQRLTKPLVDHLDDIIERVETEGIGLVIIDSFGFSMTGMDTNKQPDVTAQMARISQIPAACVIIDHISKEGKGELGPFGSIYKHAAARWMWWCRAASKQACPDGEVKNGIFVRMWNAKHNIAAQQDDIYLHIEWDDEFDAKTVRLTRVKEEDVPESLTQDITASVAKAEKAGEISATGKALLRAIREATVAAPDGIADKEWIMLDSGYKHAAVEKELQYLEGEGEIRSERVVERDKDGKRKKHKHGGSKRYQYFLTTKTVSKEEVDVTEELDKS